MQLLRDEDIELVKSCVDMRMLAEHFGIHVNGKGFANCPFHSEKTGSMKIYPGTKGYYCFGCGAGGTVFNFVMEYSNLNFEEAVKYVAAVFGIRIKEKTVLTDNDKKWIQHQKEMREFENDFKRMCSEMLSAIADDIRFYEFLQQNSEPFGDLFCLAANQLPVLKYKWDMLYEELYSKKEVRLFG